MSLFDELYGYLSTDTLCRMYYCGDHEVFEFYKECDENSIISRREYPFLESLLSFLEIDHTSDFLQLDQIDRDLILYPGYQDRKRAETAQRELRGLSKTHIYYQIMNIACRQELIKAEHYHGYSLYALNRLLRFCNNPNMYISYITEFIENVLNIDHAGRYPKRRMKQLYEHTMEDSDDVFRFQPISISYKMVKEGEIVPVLYSSNILELMDFALRTCVEREITVRRCKNCGRYFAQTGRVSAEYCSRPPAEGQAVCREFGAFQQWTLKQENDPIYKAYRREYKRRFEWIKAGRITAEAFYAWSKQAQEKHKECEKGHLSLEEFQAWLKKED